MAALRQIVEICAYLFLKLRKISQGEHCVEFLFGVRHCVCVDV